jgi:CheY-like chemotaxis protein
MRHIGEFAPIRNVLIHLFGITAAKESTSTQPHPVVLVVDDEPSICEFVRHVLEAAGYHAVCANSGAAALKLVDRGPKPDLLLTDMMMPGMAGDELAARMRQQQPDLKVLYLTGFSQALFAHRSMLWEGEAFLEKPVSAVGLVEGVSLLLHGCVSGGVTAES